MQVRIREVGPRDGFQNEPEIIATDDKVRLIDALARTGLRRLEVTSLRARRRRSRSWPTRAEVLRRIDLPDDVAVSVLIPNERGLDARWQLRERFHEVNVLPERERDAQPRERQPLDRGVAERPGARASSARREAGPALRGRHQRELRLPVRGARAARARPRDRAAAGRRRRVGDRASATRPGWRTRCRSRASSSAPRAELPDVELTAHFHNTRGQGLANVLAALQAGCTSFESSFGELGGCPVPAGATGNIATEDLVSMLHEMGIATGVDLDGCSTPRARRSEVLGRPLGSHTLVAGPVEWHAMS